MSAISESIETLELFGFNTKGFIEAYEEPHRTYHGLSLMEFMLPLASDMRDMYALNDEDYLDLMLAIWYHDKKYIPGRSDNEHESAKDALVALGSGSQVPEMILKTKRHLKPVTFLDGCLLDIDWCALGFPWELYTQNTYAIRQEFEECSEEQWTEGRCLFLDKMLALPLIFFTSWGGRYERFARRNMEREHYIMTGVEK